jgi:hypothetical protein
MESRNQFEDAARTGCHFEGSPLGRGALDWDFVYLLGLNPLTISRGADFVVSYDELQSQSSSS